MGGFSVHGRHMACFIAQVWALSLPCLCLGVAGAPQKHGVDSDGYRSSPNRIASIEPDGHVLEVPHGVGHTLIRRHDGVGSPMVVGAGNASALQEEESQRGIVQCGWSVFAPDDPCPTECPLRAEEIHNPCHFQCVTEAGCGLLDPQARVSDYEQMRCRPCIVLGCSKCSTSGKDECAECQVGYLLTDKGICLSTCGYVFKYLFSFVGLICFIMLLWAIEIHFRRPSNLRGLKHGWKFRLRTRNHMPSDTPKYLGVADKEDPSGVLYPLTTNQLWNAVGGAATTLHFNFQAFVVVWAFSIVFLWCGFGYFYSFEILRVGLMPAHTPQQLCSVVRWGATQQNKLEDVKVMFLGCAYILSFVYCIAFANSQMNRYFKLDTDTSSMKDYVGYVRGLPRLKGNENVEGILKDYLEKETQQKILAVSPAWDIIKDEEEIMEFLELEAAQLEKKHNQLKNANVTPPEPNMEEEVVLMTKGFMTTIFGNIDKFFGFTWKVDPNKKTEIDVERLRGLLESLETCDVAFAVFETEQARDAAVELCLNERGFAYNQESGKKDVHVKALQIEPGTVKWRGLSHGSRNIRRVRRLILGFLLILLSLAAWTVVFYTPYAYYISAFSYANGDEPPAAVAMVFTMLVVAGNQAMYFVCDAVTEAADFSFEDDKQKWYNIYYCGACTINVILDMFVTGYLSYLEMANMQVHTADGRLVSTLTSPTEIIEAYPMQKNMGELLFLYCFPGTFFVPFLLEPVATWWMWEHFGRLLLRSHAECQGRDAELAMSYFMPFDLGRYSDVLLNVMLATLALYTPGGFTLPIFLALGLSHVYIYFYDHWRILRVMPQFMMSRNDVDMFAHCVMAFPVGMILSCMIFKGYHIYWPELKGYSLMSVMFWTLVAHVCLHLLILRRIFNKKRPRLYSSETYPQVAKNISQTWFSANPVHCLRSKYIWGDEPAQVFHMPGKAHLQRENAKIHCYFEDKEAQQPDKPEVETVAKAKPKKKGMFGR